MRACLGTTHYYNIKNGAWGTVGRAWDGRASKQCKIQDARQKVTRYKTEPGLPARRANKMAEPKKRQTADSNARSKMQDRRCQVEDARQKTTLWAYQLAIELQDIKCKVEDNPVGLPARRRVVWRAAVPRHRPHTLHTCVAWSDVMWHGLEWHRSALMCMCIRLQWLTLIELLGA